MTTTSEEWQQRRTGFEREVTRARADLKAKMLAKIAEAGAEGVRAVDLLDGIDRDRAIGVRQQLERDGLVETAWERDDAEPVGGKVLVYRLAKQIADLAFYTPMSSIIRHMDNTRDTDPDPPCEFCGQPVMSRRRDDAGRYAHLVCSVKYTRRTHVTTKRRKRAA